MYDPKKKLSKYLFIAAFILLGYLAYRLVSPFIGTIIISLLVAYILLPFHKKLAGKTKSKNISAFLITLCIIIIGAAFFTVLISLLFNEVSALYQSIDISGVSSFIQKYIPGEKVEQYIAQFAEKGIGIFVSASSSLLLTVPEKLILLFISLCTIFFALRDHEKLKKHINMIMPVSEAYKKKINQRFSQTMDAVVYSVIVIGVLQGVIATIAFYIFGVSNPLLWGLLALILALLPFIGPALVWAPWAVYLFATGNITQAVGLALFCFILINILLDMVWKPKLIAEKGRIHPMIALLGVLGGLSVFGVSGIILGPFVLSLFIFVLSVLLGKEKILVQE